MGVGLVSSNKWQRGGGQSKGLHLTLSGYRMYGVEATAVYKDSHYVIQYTKN